MKENLSENDFWKKGISWTIIIFVVLCMLFICISCYTGFEYTLDNFYKIGGFLSGIFAAFAFGGVLITLSLQNKNNIQQKKEFKEQTKLNKIQRFEITFFNMLSLQQDIVNGLIFSDPDIEDKFTQGLERNPQEKIPVKRDVSGRYVFDFLFSGFFYSRTIMGLKDYLAEDGMWMVYNNYRHSKCFDHYFTCLYTIFKYIDKSDFLTFNEKYEYASIVRASLSNTEQLWLYYNCLVGPGNPKFKKLVEKYSILKNIRERELALSRISYDQLLISDLKKFLQENEFSGTDYEFYLTTEKDNESKYHISAFYTKDRLKEGEELVERWNKFVKELYKKEA